MNQIELLECEHWQLGSMAEELGGICAAPEPPAPLMFLNFRRKFARLLTAHLKHEDWVIYPGLLISARPEVRDAANRFFTETASFGATFGEYNRTWTSDRIAADWTGFRTATLQILAGLRHRIALEENELYPLLAQHGREDTPPPTPLSVRSPPPRPQPSPLN